MSGGVSFQMKSMRLQLLIAAAFFVCGAALSDSPLVLKISSVGVEINGIIYTTRATLVQALRQLKPVSVRFAPDKDVPYQAVADALAAFKESGIRAQTGFVGDVSE